MKKALTWVMAILLLLVPVTAQASARDQYAQPLVGLDEQVDYSRVMNLPKNGAFDQKVTSERPMPLIQRSSTKTLAQESRKIWAAETKQVLEAEYEQSVLSIKEDAESICFVFACEEDMQALAATLPVDSDLATKPQVLDITYSKPEAMAAKQGLTEGGLNGQQKMSAPMAAAAYQTRITRMYSWSGYVSVDNKTASNMITAASMAISIFPGLGSLVSSVILWVTAVIADSYDGSKPVKAITKVKNYYQTKLCSVYAYGSWVSYVQIGMRAQFRWQQAELRNSGGQPFLTKPRENNGYPDYNPTNYDRAPEYKPHFNDDTWMINKAIDIYNTMGSPYYDCFGMATIPF